MISSKNDYKYYLEQDKIALGKKIKRPRFKHDVIWKFEILMRKCEYYENCRKDIIGRIISKYYKFRYISLSQKLGFSIGFNTFGPGLSIAHYGLLVVHGNARIGKNCRIHEGVTIGATGGTDLAPTIGDNVFIGTGAKIIGAVNIADGVAIGANAAVVKDINESNTTWGGVPARKISNNDSKSYLSKELFEVN